MLAFIKCGSIDGSERKALLVAILCSLVFIVLFTVVNQPFARRTNRRLSRELMPPLAPTTTTSVDPNERYHVAPANFRNVDFNNYSYGLYTSSEGKRIKLNLKSGRLELADGSGWFELRDVYYKDLTGDLEAEAIVRLSHVRCGIPCDSGADLFYIYTQRNGKLEPIWQYETHSYECSLKSFAVSYRELVLELYGRCQDQATQNPESSNYLIKDLTYIVFDFDGQRFKQQSIEFFSTLPVNPKSYNPVIRIF